MPVARVQLEDGRVARFQVPDGTTPEQAQQIGVEFSASQAPAQPAPQQIPVDIEQEPTDFPITEMRAPGIPTGVQEALGFGPKPSTQVFPEAREETRAARELPELGSAGLLAGENRLKIAAISPAVLFTTDPRELGNILEKNFPNIGISQDPGGNLLATNNKTGAQVIINRPGISKIDILQGLGIVAAFTPAARGAAIPAQLMGRTAAGAAGAGLTQTAIEGLQVASGGEFNEEEIALATALGGVAETVFPAIQSLRRFRQARAAKVNQQELVDVTEAAAVGREAAERSGIPLFPAQKTLIPSELGKQAFISQLPAGTIKATQALKIQNKSASEAVEDFIGQLAPPEALVAGAEKFRTAAQRAVEARNIARREASSPIYKQAFRRQRQGKIGDIVTDKLQVKIKKMAQQFDPNGQISKNLIAALNKIQNAGGNLQKLHLAKTEIDQTINTFGSDSVGNTTKRFLTGVKKDLVQQLTKQSPSYQAARSEFLRLTPPLEKIQESIIGKIAGINDTQLRTISQKIFNPAETDPAIIKKAKSIISDVDPDAWNQLLRVELERRIGDTSRLIGDLPAEVAIDNVPGQLFSAIFGAGRARAKQSKVLFSALNNEQRANLKFLERGLRRASLGRAVGSQTAAREEIKRELRGGIAQSMRNFFRTPLDTLISTGEDVAFNKRVRTLAEVMFDPSWNPQMKKIIKLSPDSPAAARAMTQLLNQATGE